MSPNYIANESGDLSRLILHWLPSMQLNDDEFFDFCQVNKELRIEKTAQGDFEIMAPTGGETGSRNLSLAAQLYMWAEQEQTGIGFDSSTGFKLPNGATRSPDAAWVKKSRLKELSPEQKQKFLPLCPDFVIELRSPSDNLKILQDKMQEYMENGASLGWLIDPQQKQVFVYQPNQTVILLDNPKTLIGNGSLAGFELNLQKIWEVDF